MLLYVKMQQQSLKLVSQLCKLNALMLRISFWIKWINWDKHFKTNTMHVVWLKHYVCTLIPTTLPFLSHTRVVCTCSIFCIKWGTLSHVLVLLFIFLFVLQTLVSSSFFSIYEKVYIRSSRLMLKFWLCENVHEAYG